MSDLGLLMSAEMAIAWLEGRKTQTRRPLSPQPEPATAHPDCRAEWQQLETTTGAMFRPTWRTPNGRGGTHPDWGDPVAPRIPGSGIADIGKRVWCRETWASSVGVDRRKPTKFNRPDGTTSSGWPYWYRSDGSIRWTGAEDGGPAFTTRGKWRSSMVMPKWAARSWGKIVSVRVERAQDITEDDAESEGFSAEDDAHECPFDPVWATDAFERTWNACYASKGLGWDDNPYVVVVEWQNIDRPNQ